MKQMHLPIILICFGFVIFLIVEQTYEIEDWKTKYIASELINMWGENNDRNFEEVMKINFNETKVFEEVKKNKTVFQSHYDEIVKWYKEKKCKYN